MFVFLDYIKVVFTFLEQKQCAPARQATLNHVSANQTLIYTENRIAATQIQTQEPCTQIRTNNGTFCSIFLTNVIYCFALFIISGKALLSDVCLFVCWSLFASNASPESAANVIGLATINVFLLYFI